MKPQMYRVTNPWVQPLVLATILALLVGCSLLWPPSAKAVDVTFGWAPPDTSATGVAIPPEYTQDYDLEYSINGGPWASIGIDWSMVTTATQIGPYPPGTLLATAVLYNLNSLDYYRVRVRGVNYQDETGEWSEPSVAVRPIEYLDAGPPGKFGLAVVIGVEF